MKKLTLHYACLLNTSCDEAFAFHTDPRNLPSITPPWIHVSIISSTPHHVVLDIQRLLLTTRWEIDIALDAHQKSITDTLLKGPLSFFKHHRRFLALENGKTCMDETIELALPLGWLGNLFYPLIRRDMDKMFAFRHHATQTHFAV